MKIQTSDYFLTRFCKHSNFLLRRVADWETRYLDAKLATVRIERPVFITGLARAGTTLLLELLASIKGVATHRYRDFPFLMIPYFWNRCLDWFPVDQQPVERAHKDRIFVTRENPEAMEEPLWHTFFPHVHSNTSLHRYWAGGRRSKVRAVLPGTHPQDTTGPSGQSLRREGQLSRTAS